MKYLILNVENRGIITVTNHAPMANDLSLGFRDSVIYSITPVICKDYDILTYNYIQKNNIGLDKSLKSFNLEFVPDHFLEIKELGYQRLNLFSLVHTWGQSLLTRTNRFCSIDFIDMSILAVKESIPERKKWHRWIIEHAEIGGFTEQESYNDLKIIADCDKEVRFRVNSLCLKWSRKINEITIAQLRSDSFIEKFINQMKKEYWLDKQM